MQIQFFGACREVTGSCYFISVGGKHLLLDCGLIQGSRQHERHNQDAFPFDLQQIDAVVLSHAHLDHSGRLPLLVKQGYQGPIHTHPASAELCQVMLEDAGYLQEKDAEWENRKRERKGLEPIEPLYTRADASSTLSLFAPNPYQTRKQILPGVWLTLHDAGHILGSAIVELELEENGKKRTLVFSGDLGHAGAPILPPPATLKHADLLLLESTYGDRLHRDWENTWEEMGEVFQLARETHGNVLIPAFAVGRTQQLLHIFRQYMHDWKLDHWQIFLDSPMAIRATEVYSHHVGLYNLQARDRLSKHGPPFELPNLQMTRSSIDSMKINQFKAGAIIIAGSGMCTGGRIKHHLKHNIWRRQNHVMIVGFQAKGTLGRSLVDGARHIRLWGETVQVNAHIHTIGGLSAHADQQGLLDWYRAFENRPRIALVHGEESAMYPLADALRKQGRAQVDIPEFGQVMDI
ncbi:MAG: MBL fold metallo-hydrolase [Gammaproteobacteria bacterium]|nr:MBL fold metallo-hydrolase [Gammaproteobacteria bacterium]